jgi:CBS domain-containing protein
MSSGSLALDVRTRRTLRADWGEEESPLVTCPLTRSSRSLEDCRQCARNAGVIKDSTGHWFVVCRAELGVEAPPADGSVESWEALRVGEIMSGSPYCVHRDVGVAEIVALFVEQGISGVPVVDDAGHPIGIVSRADVLMDDYERAEGEESPGWFEGKHPSSRAEDIMTPRSTSISERANAMEAVRVLAEHRIHRLAVVDDAGSVVGILSTLDVIRALAARARPR